MIDEKEKQFNSLHPKDIRRIVNYLERIATSFEELVALAKNEAKDGSQKTKN